MTPGNDDRTILEMQRDATEPILLETPPAATSSRPLIDDVEPDRPPFSDRLREWRRHYFPLPDEVVEEYLGEDEYVVHTDHPSFRAFLIQNIVLVLVVSIAGPVFVTMVRGGFDWTTLLLFLAIDIVLLYMAIQRLRDRYISYVITNLRLIRLAGIFGRRLNSIPWTRMTGLGYFQKPMGRILGYATVFIESANEESGLRSFSNINDPATFHQRILDMVSSKTGQSAGGKIPPPTKGERKSIFQKRRERRGKGGALRAAAEWPTVADEGGGSGERGATDVAGAYASATGDEKAADSSKQTLHTKGGKGRAKGGKGRIPGSGGGSGGGAGGGGSVTGPSGRPDGPGSQKRRPQLPPSARRRQPPPPAPTNPWGDPEPAAFRTSEDAQRRRPRMRDEEGLAAPSDMEAERGGRDDPHSPTRPAQRLPGARRPAPRRQSDPDSDAPVDADADQGDDEGPDDDPPRGGGGIPPVDPPPRPSTPPRGNARIRPGEPRTPPGGTSAVTGSPSEPAGPRPQRPPSRRTPPGGTGAVRPGEPRPRSRSSRESSETPAADTPQEGPAARPQARADQPVPRRRRADVRHEAAPEDEVVVEAPADEAAMASAPVIEPEIIEPEPEALVEDVEDEPEVIGIEVGDIESDPDELIGEPVDEAPADAPPAPERRPRRPARDEPADADEPQLSSAGKAAETFTPPRPRTPPSSRRQAEGRTPAGGTRPVRPTEARRATESGSRPAQSPSQPQASRAPRAPRPPQPPRRPADETDSETPDAPPSSGWGRLGSKDPDQRRAGIFGRRLRWSRRPEPEEDDDFDGSARDAVGFVRPPGFARRTAQSFRRPRVSMSGRRRSIFPPGRELTAGSDSEPRDAADLSAAVPDDAGDAGDSATDTDA